MTTCLLPLIRHPNSAWSKGIFILVVAWKINLSMNRHTAERSIFYHVKNGLKIRTRNEQFTEVDQGQLKWIANHSTDKLENIN